MIISKSENYATKNKEIIDKECSIILIAVEKDIKKWQTAIQEKLLKWFKENNVKTAS